MGEQPKRIQRKRTKGWRMPEAAVSVTRPGPFGNPFTHRERRVAAGMFRVWLTGGMRSTAMLDCGCKLPTRSLPGVRDEILCELQQLRGRDLACWCPLPAPGQPDHCHATVLLELANRGGEDA